MSKSYRLTVQRSVMETQPFLLSVLLYNRVHDRWQEAVFCRNWPWMSEKEQCIKTWWQSLTLTVGSKQVYCRVPAESENCNFCHFILRGECGAHWHHLSLVLEWNYLCLTWSPGLVGAEISSLLRQDLLSFPGARFQPLQVVSARCRLGAILILLVLTFLQPGKYRASEKFIIHPKMFLACPDMMITFSLLCTEYRCPTEGISLRFHALT